MVHHSYSHSKKKKHFTHSIDFLVLIKRDILLLINIHGIKYDSLGGAKTLTPQERNIQWFHHNKENTKS
jgi:hypothetical protein